MTTGFIYIDIYLDISVYYNIVHMICTSSITRNIKFASGNKLKNNGRICIQKALNNEYKTRLEISLKIMEENVFKRPWIMSIRHIWK